MIEVTGNLWTYQPADARVITTNGFVKKDGRCVMGRGCAQEARDAFPGLDLKLGTLIRAHSNRVMNLGLQRTVAARIISFPVKHKWDQEADPKLIERSAHQLAELTSKLDLQSVIVPRPGCGNGRLKWQDVKKILEPILDDRFRVITFSRNQ